MADDIEIAVLLAMFDAREGSDDVLCSALARYVVMTRHEPGCRNVDLIASVTRPGRFLVIEKWDSADQLRAHLDSPLMVGMANEAMPSLADKPEIDWFDSISAHDLA